MSHMPTTSQPDFVSSSIYVDLRSSPFGLVADDTSLTARQQNTGGLAEAIAEYSGSNAVLMLPRGVVSFEELAGNHCIKFGTGVSDLTLAGFGMFGTIISQYTNGDSGEQDLIVLDGCQRIQLFNFGVRQDRIGLPDPGQQNHLICFYNTVLGGTTRDINVSNIYFGKCIGDAMRIVAADPSDRVVNVRASNFVMQLAGTVTSDTPNGRTGARSGIAMQRGGQDCSFTNFYIRGMQNSGIDEEPSGGTGERNAYRHFVIDNRISSTVSACSFGGASTAVFEDGWVSDGYILGGQVNLLGASNGYRFERITIETTAPTPTAPTEALFLIRSSGGVGHSDLQLSDITLRRTGTSGVGGCLDIINNGQRTRLSRILCEQGVSGDPVLIDGSPNLSADGVTVKYSGTSPGARCGVIVQAVTADASDLNLRNIDVSSTTGDLQAAVRLDQRLTFDMERVQIRDVRCKGQATTGVYLSYDDRGGGGIADFTPELSGIVNEAGAGAVWTQVNQSDNPVTNVYPIISGNRFEICSMTGVVDPEGAVTAVQGCTYVWQDGDTTTMWFKQTGTSNTGWVQLSP